MIWTVDRIEEKTAVIETPAGMIKVELQYLPQGVREGSKISLDIDAKEEETVRKRIEEKKNSLFVD